MRWANKGYAVVSQDVRGRADSEGELIPFYNERDDGYDTIDWIIAQEWSDGNVGMWGASYLGFVVVAAATSGHPNLKAVVDEVNVGSPFVDTVRKGEPFVLGHCFLGLLLNLWVLGRILISLEALR